MKQRPRIYYTETDKALIWDRWQKGESLHSIAGLFGRHHSAIQGILSRTGGIRPPQRRRSQRALTLAEREEISRGVIAGQSLRWIAASLGRAPSTVSREIKRNGGRRRYRASSADQAAWERAQRPKTCKLKANPALARIVLLQTPSDLVRNGAVEAGAHIAVFLTRSPGELATRRRRGTSVRGWPIRLMDR